MKSIDWSKEGWERQHKATSDIHWVNRVIVEPESDLPVAPNPEGSEIISIIQLFYQPGYSQQGYVSPEEVVSRCLTPALWAYKSWYYNTDMVEEQVTFKWYIEKSLEDYAKPVLERNGVDWDRDVWVWERYYDYLGMGCEAMGMLDERFKKYKRLVHINCDLFAMPGIKAPVFSYLKSHSDPVYGVPNGLGGDSSFGENKEYWDSITHYRRYAGNAAGQLEEVMEIAHVLQLNEFFHVPSNNLTWYGGDFSSMPLDMPDNVNDYIHKFMKLTGSFEHLTIPLKWFFGINVRCLYRDTGITWLCLPEDKDLIDGPCLAHMIGQSKEQLKRLGIPTDKFRT